MYQELIKMNAAVLLWVKKMIWKLILGAFPPSHQASVTF